jgi:hypothetical protein
METKSPPSDCKDKEKDKILIKKTKFWLFEKADLKDKPFKTTTQNSFCWVLGGEREGAERVVREGVGAVGRNEPILVCTYE